MSHRRATLAGTIAACVLTVACAAAPALSDPGTPPAMHIVAGGGVGDGASALLAKVHPAQVALGRNGDIYTLGLGRVRKIDHSTGLISTVLGSRGRGGLQDGQQASATGMSSGYNYRLVGVGDDGTVYLTETFPGSPTDVFQIGADGTVRHLLTALPKPVAVAADGTIYTTGTNQVLQTAPGTTTPLPFAGTGTAGHTGEGGPAVAAQIGPVNALTAAPDGTVYFFAGGYVQHVDAAGTIHTIGGTGAASGGSQPPDGVEATSVALAPNSLTVASGGRVYLLNYVFSHPAVRVINTDGTLGTVIASTPSSYFPVLAADPTGVLYPDGVQLFHFDGDGSQQTGPGTLVAGSTASQSPDGTAAADAYLASLGNAVYDGSGRLLFTSLGLIRTVADGRLSTVAGGGTPADGYGDGLPGPQAATHAWSMAAAPNGDVYFVDVRPLGFGDVENRIRVLHTDGTVGAVAGGGTKSPPTTGASPATSIALPGQTGHALAATNNHVYYASENNVIYDITDGTISRYVGGGSTPIDASTPATDGQDVFLDRLGAVAIDPISGDLFAAELHNLVRVNTAGQTRQAFATPAAILQMAFGSDGSLYYSDGAIERRWPDGGVATVAGNGADNSDGAPVLSAHIGGITGLDVGPDGSLALPGSRDDGTWEVRVADAYTPPPAPTTLGATSSASRVIAGRPSTITATLRRGTTDLADHHVTLRQQQSPGGAWSTVSTASTDHNGTATFAVTPTINTHYRIVYAGMSTEQPSTSDTLTISVQPRVTAHLASTRLHKGERTAMRGVVSPNQHGHTVALQRHTKTGWHTLTLHALTTRSKARFMLKAAKIGTFTYRIYDPATDAQVAGPSNQVKLKVLN